MDEGGDGDPVALSPLPPLPHPAASCMNLQHRLHTHEHARARRMEGAKRERGIDEGEVPRRG